ncbi:MAG TPA: RNA 2',3'-cyclic phosphodiesterase [Verrucomicrobiae bacterium]|jgi:2'-5' RNA ligase
MAASETMRLFSAIFPPPEIAQRLAEAARTLAGNFTSKAAAWTAAEQIHLTLNFLGQVEPARVDAIARAVDEAARRGQRHRVQARGLGCFPNAARPRVIWAGLDGDMTALSALKQNLDDGLAGLGFPPEDRAFHPHLTIGRFKNMNGRERGHLAEALRRWSETKFASWTVERIDLMRSEFSPGGSRYTLVRSFAIAERWSTCA